MKLKGFSKEKNNNNEKNTLIKTKNETNTSNTQNKNLESKQNKILV